MRKIKMRKIKLKKEKVYFKDLSFWLKTVTIYSSISMIWTFLMVILLILG